MANSDQPDLTSWKEIADRLQITVRTAQEWEKKRGLPVRRVPGPRGRVFMRLDELETWLTRGGVAAASETDSSPAASSRTSPPARPSRVWLAAVIAATAVAVALAIALARSSARALPQTPAQWQIQQDTLIIRNEEGDELWRKHFDEGLSTQTYEQPEFVQTQLVDLDGDGSLEVLFPLWLGSYGTPAILICFDAGGKERWRYGASATIRTATERFENIYRVASFLPVELSNGATAIVVASVHYAFYPSQVALISAVDGRVLGAYWHAGHIGNLPFMLAVGDRDGDGRQEVYAAGVSNAYNRATLVVLDLEGMRGASVEEDPAYQLEGFEAPNEIVRILFPRSSMSALADDYNVARRVWLTPEFVNVGVLESIMDPGKPMLIYQLRRDFARQRVMSSTTFDGAHNRLVREGELTKSLEQELASLPPLQYIGRRTVPLSGR